MRYKRCVSQMEDLGLQAMADRTKALQKSPDYDGMSHDEVLEDITRSQLEHNHQRKVEREIVASKIPYPQFNVEDMGIHLKRQVDMKYLSRMLDGQWINDHQNIVITGRLEADTIRLASMFARSAIEQGYKVQSFELYELLEQIQAKRLMPVKGRKSEFKKFGDTLQRKPDVLLLRGVGQANLTIQECENLDTLVRWREKLGGIIVTSPFSTKDWPEFFGHSPAAYSIVSGLLEHAHCFELKSNPSPADEGGEL